MDMLTVSIMIAASILLGYCIGIIRGNTKVNRKIIEFLNYVETDTKMEINEKITAIGGMDLFIRFLDGK